jgi:hypothetical protein
MMRSNTGAKSSDAALIACTTSAIAACCARASSRSTRAASSRRRSAPIVRPSVTSGPAAIPPPTRRAAPRHNQSSGSGGSLLPLRWCPSTAHPLSGAVPSRARWKLSALAQADADRVQRDIRFQVKSGRDDDKLSCRRSQANNRLVCASDLPPVAWRFWRTSPCAGPWVPIVGRCSIAASRSPRSSGTTTPRSRRHRFARAIQATADQELALRFR